MFKSLPIARAIHRLADLPESTLTYPRDTVTLGWEERLKARARRQSDQGFEFATALPRGTLLRNGDFFMFEAPALVVGVAERAEPVFVIRPKTPQEWALFGYHIGNSHQPVMISNAEIVCPDVPGMEQVLTYHGIEFSRADRAFTPVSLVVDHQHQLAR